MGSFEELREEEVLFVDHHRVEDRGKEGSGSVRVVGERDWEGEEGDEGEEQPRSLTPRPSTEIERSFQHADQVRIWSDAVRSGATGGGSAVGTPIIRAASLNALPGALSVSRTPSFVALPVAGQGSRQSSFVIFQTGGVASAVGAAALAAAASAFGFGAVEQRSSGGIPKQNSRTAGDSAHRFARTSTYDSVKYNPSADDDQANPSSGMIAVENGPGRKGPLNVQNALAESDEEDEDTTRKSLAGKIRARFSRRKS
uniref:Uncharacterized protein n=1 Tax=Compsopogon caeruleus TaxID=31354 RepID=A0A7S1THQ0_9RHOD|mmetsp:Transcript_8232/g.16659  ORF Transcript_8232/g.16659 Transcript_8232/m.16659 type:complete len:256 (+) Transcript_8232:268-1035(+)